MMGRRTHDQEQFFYSFRLDEAVPDDHPVREVAAVLDLSWVHSELAPYYPRLGRPSIDPVLMIRMLIIGYVFAIRSERALCRDVGVALSNVRFRGNSGHRNLRASRPLLTQSGRNPSGAMAHAPPEYNLVRHWGSTMARKTRKRTASKANKKAKTSSKKGTMAKTWRKTGTPKKSKSVVRKARARKPIPKASESLSQRVAAAFQTTVIPFAREQLHRKLDPGVSREPE